MPTRSEHVVNSAAYWDRRFRENWEERGGPSQTRFFAEQAVAAMPDWLVQDVRARRLSIFDFGCAFGDALPVLRGAFPEVSISGGDVASEGITAASRRHRDFEFYVLDGDDPRISADVIFCSNTLEHFADWRAKLTTLVELAREYVVVLAPFQERNLTSEHEAYFDYGTFVPVPGELYRLDHLRIVDVGSVPDTYWAGRQWLGIWGKAAKRSPSPEATIVSAADLDLRGRTGEEVRRLLTLARIADCREQDLRAEVAHLEGRSREVDAEIARLRERESGARAEIERLEGHSRQAEEEIARLERRSGDAEAELALLKRNAGEARAELARLENRERETETERRRLGDQVQALLHSTSWRVTAPLRWSRSALPQSAVALGKAFARSRTRSSEPDIRIGETDRITAPPPSSRRSGCSRGERRLVSIVLPVFNQANFLSDAIDGVLAQTYPHWELIVIDDGSEDEVDDVLARYVRDLRIRVFRQPNQKLPSALNNGFEHARGEYLTWTSADNIMLPGQLARLVQALESNPSAGLAYSDYEAIDDRGEPLADPSFRPQNRPDGSSSVRLPGKTTLANFHESGDNFLGASFLYRADVAAVVGRYDDGTFGGEDYDYWLRMHLVSQFVHVGEILYRYRVHDNTLNARAKELNLARNVERLLDADRNRRSLCLRDGTLGGTESDFWRQESQYTQKSLRHRAVPYSVIAAGVILPGLQALTQVVRIDVPLRLIEVKLLKSIEIILTSDELTFFWLKRQRSLRCCRILFTDQNCASAAVEHAVALREFERRTEQQRANLPKPPAMPSSWAIPKHALLVVDVWRHGGLEQVILDLGAALDRRGTKATIGVALGEATEDLRARAAAHGSEVVSFAGDLGSFTSFLQERAVDWVSYHHSLFGLQEAQDRHLRTSYTAHTSYIWLEGERRLTWRAQLPFVDSIIAVSRQSAAYLHRHFEIDADKLIVVPNGVDLSSITLPAERSRPKGAYSFLHVGSFDRIKMQKSILRAFRGLISNNEDVSLTLLGFPLDKQFYAETMDLREELKLEGVVTVIPGASHARVIELMRSHDCFVLPSLIEGWSIALIEAVLCGMSAVVTDVGAARDMRLLSSKVEVIPHPLGELEELLPSDVAAYLHADTSALELNLSSAMRKLRDRPAVSSGAEEVQLAREYLDVDRMAGAYLHAIAAR